MFSFFKKSPIVFACSIPAVLDRYPVEPASKVKRSWIKSSVAAYKHQVQAIGKTQGVSGTAKCPGLHNIIGEGYILRSWFDLTVQTTNDDYAFNCTFPTGMASVCKDNNFNEELISSFSGKQPNLAVPVSEGSIKSLIKINTPWAVKIPKGWSMLMLPVSYGNDTRFSDKPGILTEGEFYTINPIIEWHVKNSVGKIEAGTPLLQMIPIRSEKAEATIQLFDNSFYLNQKYANYETNHKNVRS